MHRVYEQAVGIQERAPSSWRRAEPRLLEEPSSHSSVCAVLCAAA